MPFHPGFRGKPIIPLTFAHTDSDNQTDFATTYTFTNQSIGTAAADRYILVSTPNGTQTTVPTSCTVGGVSATSIANGRFWLVAFPTGTTATIVLNFAGNTAFVHIGVTAIYGLLKTTPHDTVEPGTSVTDNPRTASIDVAAGGVVVAYDISAHVGSSSDHSWSGVTERFENDVNGSPTAHTVSGGSLGFATQQTVNIAVTRSGGDGSGSGRLYAVSFAPL